MIRTTCKLCPKLQECELNPRDCNRNNTIYNLVRKEVKEIIEDLHRVITEIERDGDE